MGKKKTAGKTAADLLQIERVPIESLTPDPENARLHSDAQLEDLKASLKRFGQLPTIFVSAENIIIKGNGTYEAAKRLGLSEVDIIRVPFKGAEARAYAIADNRLGETSEWDLNRLNEHLRELVADGWEMPELGWDQSALEDVLGWEFEAEAKPEPPPEAEIDRADELLKKWKVERGQVWEIGKHRLMCGDSTEEGDRGILLDGCEPDIAVIDPPFEMAESKWLPLIMDPCIVFGQAKHLRAIPDSLFRFERIIDKVTAHRSATVQIGHRHAFVAQCGTKKVLPKNRKTFPSIVVAEERENHRHEKPIDLLIDHLVEWSPEWETAFDPFSGSGTTLVASEQLGRRCLGMEREPRFCAVILERMSNMGLTPSVK